MESIYKTQREAQPIEASVDGAYPVTFSTETPVMRNVYSLGMSPERTEELKRALGGMDVFYEVLGHAEGEIVTQRAQLPLLMNHNHERTYGKVTDLEFTQSGRGKIKVSRNSPDISNDIEDSIISDVSVGAEVLRYSIDGELDGIKILRATKWTPLEVSLITVGADPKAGINRSKPKQEKIQIMENEPDKKQEIDVKGEVARAVESERKRISNVLSAIEYCSQRGMEIPEGTREKADKEGWGYNDVCTHVLKNQNVERSKEIQPDITEVMEKHEKRSFSLARALKGFMDGKLTGFEAEVDAETRRNYNCSGKGLAVSWGALTQRAMTAGAYGSGGSFVPVTQGEVIQKLDPIPVVEMAGGRMFRALNNPVSFPRVTDGATAHWVAENESVSESSMGTDDVLMSPHGLSAYVEVSRQLALSVDAENLVRSDILRRINLAVDKAALVGSGTAGIVKGIFQLNTSTSGINTVTFGGSPDWGDIVDFEGLIEDADGLDGSLSFITSAPVKAAWKATSRDTGSGMFLANGNNANGYPIYVTSQLKGTTYANRVVFGNFNNLIIGMSGAIELLIDQSSALQRRGMIGITGLTYADVAVAQPASFAVSTDAGNQ